MKRKKLTYAYTSLQRTHTGLVRHYQLTRVLARSVVGQLRSALAPFVVDGQELDETGSEQVARCDQAIRYALLYLDWIENASSLSGWQFLQMLRDALEEKEASRSSLPDLRVENLREMSTVEVSDPDTGGIVGLSIFKTERGSMFAIDTAFLRSRPDTVIPSPFDASVFFYHTFSEPDLREDHTSLLSVSPEEK